MKKEIISTEAAKRLASQFGTTVQAGRHKAMRLFDSGKIVGRIIGHTIFFQKESFETYMKGEQNYVNKKPERSNTFLNKAVL